MTVYSKSTGKHYKTGSFAIFCLISIVILAAPRISHAFEFHSRALDALKPVADGSVTIVESAPAEMNCPKSVNAEDGFSDLVDNAKHELLFESYYIQKGVSEKFIAALKNAARRGVKIKMLLADIGPADKTLAVELVSEFPGVDVRYIDLRKNRWLYGSVHCKTVIADERYTSCGGTNYSFAGFFENRETSVIIDDKNFAHNMKSIFESDWRMAAPGNVFAGSASPNTKTGDAADKTNAGTNKAPDVTVQAARTFQKPLPCDFLLLEAAPAELNNPYIHNLQPTLGYLIDRAKQSIFMEMDYISDFGGVSAALERAAARGVSVRLIIEHRSYFDENPLYQPARDGIERLAKTGMNVMLFNLSPLGKIDNRGMMHSKAAVIDGEWVFVGSANISKSGLLYSREAGVIFKNKNISAALLEIFEKDSMNPFCLSAAEAIAGDHSYEVRKGKLPGAKVFVRRAKGSKMPDAVIFYNGKPGEFKIYRGGSALLK